MVCELAKMVLSIPSRGRGCTNPIRAELYTYAEGVTTVECEDHRAFRFGSESWS